MKKILLTNIQRFSLHDGPGIRTTVFLKGCSLHCPWCSNPENINPFQELYTKDGIQGTYGRYFDSEDLIGECLKDKVFYEGKLKNREEWCITSSRDINMLPGGVTFSGGEPLLQIEPLAPVIQSLHKSCVHIAIETCLFVPSDNLNLAINNIDFFYVDIKIMSSDRCKSIENGNIDIFLENLQTLLTWRDDFGRHKPTVIRIPVIGTYTDDSNNRELVYQLIRKYKDRILKIELIKEHNLGENKYKSLGKTLDYHGVEDRLMVEYKEELSAIGIETEICTI